MINFQTSQIGKPGNIKPRDIRNIAKGEDWGTSIKCRTFGGDAVINPDLYRFIVTFGRTDEDNTPFAVFRSDENDNINLIDPVEAEFEATFNRTHMQDADENRRVVVNYWIEPINSVMGGRVRQHVDYVTLQPSIEPPNVTPVEEPAPDPATLPAGMAYAVDEFGAYYTDEFGDHYYDEQEAA